MKKTRRQSKNSGTSLLDMAILIIENSRKPNAPSLSKSLASLASFNLLTASSSTEALNLLATEDNIQMVVVDLGLTELEAFKIIPRITREFHNLTIVAISTRENEASIEKYNFSGSVKVLDSALDIFKLQNDIVFGKKEKNPPTVQPPQSLASLIKLLELEKQSAFLSMNNGNCHGSCCVINGQLTEAYADELAGEEALKSMLKWKDLEINVSEYSSTVKIGAAITKPLLEIIDEIYIDNTKGKPQKDGRKKAGSIKKNLPGTTPTIPDNETANILQNLLDNLKKATGFKAFGIIDTTGELLFQQSVDPGVNITTAVKTYNQIFHSAHDASAKIGLEACGEVVFNTQAGIILLHCPAVEKNIHCHLITILTNDGNQALAKREIEDVMPWLKNRLSKKGFC